MQTYKLICVYLVYVHFILGVFGGDIGCLLDETTERIQIALFADVTGTNYENVKNVFGPKTKEIMAVINKLRKGTEFAITIHANWQKDAFNNQGSTPHNDPEGCYIRKANFTADHNHISKVASNLSRINGPNRIKEENSMSAISFTVADLSLGWVPGGRVPFKGDGTDTCAKSLPATRDQAASVLRNHGVKIIGVYVNMDKNDYDKYNRYFDGYSIAHLSKNFADKRQLERELVPFITEQIKTHLECIFEDPIGYNSLGL